METLWIRHDASMNSANLLAPNGTLSAAWLSYSKHKHLIFLSYNINKKEILRENQEQYAS